MFFFVGQCFCCCVGVFCYVLVVLGPWGCWIRNQCKILHRMDPFSSKSGPFLTVCHFASTVTSYPRHMAVSILFCCRIPWPALTSELFSNRAVKYVKKYGKNTKKNFFNFCLSLRGPRDDLIQNQSEILRIIGLFSNTLDF